MEKSQKSPLDRRNFLKGAAVGAAALVAESPVANAQQAEPVRAAALSASRTNHRTTRRAAHFPAWAPE